MHRLVVVSNRVPVGRLDVAVGGLEVGLLAAMRALGGLWFGWNGEIVSRTDNICASQMCENIEFATLTMSRGDYEGFYLGFSNSTLWPAFHGFAQRVRFLPAHYAAYRQANCRYSEVLRPRLRDEDLLWIHDYHLIPMGRSLRALNVRQPLGFFLHIPFPSPDAQRAIPVFGELLRDLLEFDLVGFQTESDRGAFLNAVVESVGAHVVRIDGAFVIAGRRIETGVFPIGADMDAIASDVIHPILDKSTTAIDCGGIDRVPAAVMLGADRLDYSKGVNQRLTAYERLLHSRPEVRGQFIMMQIVCPSRVDAAGYTHLQDELQRSVRRINGAYATRNWMPVWHSGERLPHRQLMHLLSKAAVGVVTPLRDGMNLVAKEFVAAQDPRNPGALILSSTAGSARELPEAILVDPHDPEEVASAMHRALTMPLGEHIERHGAMLKSLRRSDVHAWYSRFVARLISSGPRAARRSKVCTPVTTSL